MLMTIRAAFAAGVVRPINAYDPTHFGGGPIKHLAALAAIRKPTVVTTLAVISKSAFIEDAAAACIAKGVKIEVVLPSISEVTLDFILEWLGFHIDEPSFLRRAADLLAIPPLSNLMSRYFARETDADRATDRIAAKMHKLFIKYGFADDEWIFDEGEYRFNDRNEFGFNNGPF
ncbi:hypothetical protein H9P43_002970 [Blastocladiella emersonii ATCC 22665]|nr:hypothetical protein H9P43_002970 [Blastocladiella emersonii ATCC 22665]